GGGGGLPAGPLPSAGANEKRKKKRKKRKKKSGKRGRKKGARAHLDPGFPGTPSPSSGECAGGAGGRSRRDNFPFSPSPTSCKKKKKQQHHHRYKYVVDGKPEGFERALDGTADRTLNDFYGREVTHQAMPQFRAPFDDDPKGHWTRQSKSEIFDDGYIPTVHFSGQAADKYMVSAQDATVDVLFVGRTQAQKFTVRGVAASAKNTEFAKAQLKIDFTGDVFYGRSAIKLRNSESDATMMREQLYGEMLRAAGAPVQESVKARVYYNKKPYGLLELQDQTSNGGFIAELFYGSGVARPAALGVPLECSTGADFSPDGPYDAFQQIDAKRQETNSRVADLSKALAALDVANADAVAEFEKSWFDIESFFKAMCSTVLRLYAATPLSPVLFYGML
ncbi:MAG: hypothetical protein BJ554DRAFT_7003, partial [Olpidium bornovanus]